MAKSNSNPKSSFKSSVKSKSGGRLSAASIYEQMFQTRHRRPGRPAGEGAEVVFPSAGRNRLLHRIAQRRAFAVVHEEQRERLAEVFAAEIKVLERRGVEQVAADSGVELS